MPESSAVTDVAARRATVALTLLTLLLLLMPMLGGCQLAGVMAHTVAGGPRKVNVKAQYRGLENRSIAVLVAVDEMTQFQHADASLKIGRAVSARISDQVPGARVVDPRQIDRFKKDNPYWTTMLVSQLIQRLGVERLVYVDLAEFRTHEPGNHHVWQGVAVATVSVLEAEAEQVRGDADQFVFSAPVHALFPEDSTLGVLDSDKATIELGLLSILARDVTRLFIDHQIEVK